jgi:hypothetical protein
VQRSRSAALCRPVRAPADHTCGAPWSSCGCPRFPVPLARSQATTIGSAPQVGTAGKPNHAKELAALVLCFFQEQAPDADSVAPDEAGSPAAECSG